MLNEYVETKNQNGIVHLFLIVVIIVLLIAGGAYFAFSQYSSDSDLNLGSIGQMTDVVDRVAGTPKGKVESAIDKMIGVDTAYVDLRMDVKSMVTRQSNGLTQTIDAIASGYLTGSGETEEYKSEISISSPLNPGVSVKIETIIDMEENVYLKGPATEGKWWKFSKEDFEEESAKNPTDASLYGLVIVGTLLDENKALLKTIDRESITQLPNVERDGKTYERYSVVLSNPGFISALESDEDATESDVEDARKILADAVMSAELTIDKDTGYITSIKLDAKHLTQIQTEESKALGFDTRHDMVVSADISRINVPLEITFPDPADVIEK